MSTDRLVAFLEARMDERESWARLALEAEPNGATRFANLVADAGEVLGDLEIEIITAVDPARVLADVESKRQIIGYCQATLGEYTEMVGAGVLELLALPHADHQDFDTSWQD